MKGAVGAGEEIVRTRAQPGTVYLAGAGPGDPELLTLRVLRLLETSDVILPDDLVSQEILSLAHAGAEITPVGKRCGQPRITQAVVEQFVPRTLVDLRRHILHADEAISLLQQLRPLAGRCRGTGSGRWSDRG